MTIHRRSTKLDFRGESVACRSSQEPPTSNAGMVELAQKQGVSKSIC